MRKWRIATLAVQLLMIGCTAAGFDDPAKEANHPAHPDARAADPIAIPTALRDHAGIEDQAPTDMSGAGHDHDMLHDGGGH